MLSEGMIAHAPDNAAEKNRRHFSACAGMSHVKEKESDLGFQNLSITVEFSKEIMKGDKC